LRKTQSNLSGDAIIYCHRMSAFSSSATTLIRLFEFLKNIHKGLALQAKKLKHTRFSTFWLAANSPHATTIASARTIDSTL
jgi:hypothetical protein